MDLINLLLHAGDLLAVNKPAGLVCHPTKGDAYSSLISRLRLHLGGTQAWLVHRLDRETSGVVVATTTALAARDLGRTFEQRLARKTYWAIVSGHPPQDTFSADAPLGPDPASPVAIQDTVRPDGAPALTVFTVLHRFQRNQRPYTWLRAEPVTGRKHQIRIHLAHLGHPIVGDKIYGGDPTRYLRFVRGELTSEDSQALEVPFHALHARTVAFPWRGDTLHLLAEPEPWFTEFLNLDPDRLAALDHG